MKQGASIVVSVAVVVCGWAGEAAAQSTAGSAPATPGPSSAPWEAGTAPSMQVNPRPQPHEDEDEGLFGPVRVGAVGGVGFPRPLSIEGMLKFDKVAAVGIEYSVFPKFTLDNVSTTFWALDVDARVFPLQNGFFLGLAAGHQHLGASTALTLSTQPGNITIPEQVLADTWFINPRIGYLSTWGSGITLGIDAGAQIPLNATVASSLPSGISVTDDVNNVARFFAKTTLPTVNLLRLGLLL
jgi:hypothetical protein